MQNNKQGNNILVNQTEFETDRKKQAERTQAETVGSPANLIMTGCELDSLTDGPRARL